MSTILKLLSAASAASASYRLPLFSDLFVEIATHWDGLTADDRKDEEAEDPERDAKGYDIDDEDDEEDDDEETLPTRSYRAKNPTTYEAFPADFVDDGLERSDDNVAKPKKEWFKAWKEGGHERLANIVLEHEITGRLGGSPTLHDTDTQWSGDVMHWILLSAENIVIESVAFGNLAIDRRRNRYLSRLVERLWHKSKYMPGIYHQQLVNDQGESPTKRQLLHVIDIMRDYVVSSGHPQAKGPAYNKLVDHKKAYDIDNFRGLTSMKLSKNGYRKYLWAPNNDNQPMKKLKKPVNIAHLTASKPRMIEQVVFNDSKGQPVMQHIVISHIKSILVFCDRLESRLNEIPDNELDKPLMQPLVKVGYSAECQTCLQSHADHEGSNYIMNLMEAIFAQLYEDKMDGFDHIYAVEQNVIYLIWRPEQAEIAEIGWAKLADSYAGNGGGFTHYTAGMSNRSAQRIKASTWSYAALVALDASPLRANIDALEMVEDDRALPRAKPPKMLKCSRSSRSTSRK